MFTVGGILASALIAYETGAFSNLFQSNPATSNKTLVVVIHGTFGENGTWYQSDATESSFTDHLKLTLGDAGEVVPFQWDTRSIDMHQKRIEAAEKLCRYLNSESQNFRKVILIGHSHGGNVALLAATAANRSVDAVICLATPHLGFQCKDATLPIYCSPTTLDKVDHILSIAPNSDWVPNNIQDVGFKGISENEAMRLCEDWHAIHGRPDPRRKGLFELATQGSNLTASKVLNIRSVHNLQLNVITSDPLHIRSHHAVHSTEMGRYLGEVIKADFDPQVMSSINDLTIDDQESGESLLAND